MALPPITSDFVAYAKRDGKTMPLRIKAVGNVFIVDYPIVMNSGFNEGDTIFSINGVDSKDILKRMYDLWGSEIDNGIKESSVNLYLSLLFWHMYRWCDSYVFMVKHGSKIEKKNLEGVPQSLALKVIKGKDNLKISLKVLVASFLQIMRRLLLLFAMYIMKKR